MRQASQGSHARAAGEAVDGGRQKPVPGEVHAPVSSGDDVDNNRLESYVKKGAHYLFIPKNAVSEALNYYGK